ncbi:hydrogen gas-evolving membrane-bound hydrogenase subunit E [Arenivirga flava]
MTAVLLAGVTGYGMVALFAMHGSPDIALTQALVETLTLVVFVLVFRRLPKKIAQRNKPSHRTVRLVIASLVGIVMAIVGVVVLGARSDDPVSLAMPELAYEEGHGRNVVNVLLVDIRAWDTMLEISVLVVVATGIASLLFLDSRAGSAPRLAGIRERRSWSSRRKVGAEPSRGDGGTQQTWLVAGRTLSAENRSIMVEVVVRLLFHPAILVSIYLLLAGHNDPGGGFAGGLLAGLALVARYLAGGRYELGEALPVDAGKVLGVGLILAVGTALVPLLFGQEALESTYWAAELPVLGYVSFTTSMIFDVGVYLVVIGLVLDVLRSLGGEVDRHAEIAADRDRETRPTGLETDTENLPTEEGAR